MVRTLGVRSFVLPFALTLAACRSGSTPIPEARADESAPGAAVVELFTSEGCSSCPPADVVLSELAQSADRRIYPLEFHVDYWDSLGWPDRFASRENTARQGSYGRAFGLRGLYTPQMIVGGTEQFTGSDRARAEAAIARVLAHRGTVQLSVHARAVGPGTVMLDYAAVGAPAESVLNVAIVERSVSTSVRAGENAGKTLRHANVVRGFTTTPIAPPAGTATGTRTGTVLVAVPVSLARDGAELVAYLQKSRDDGGMAVLAADRSALPLP